MKSSKFFDRFTCLRFTERGRMIKYIQNNIPIILLMLSFNNCLTVYAKKTRKKMKQLQIESSAFQEGGIIPAKYTCDGTDISPPLAWHNIPPATKSFVLICDDPDAPAGTWVHWVVYDIPRKVTELSEGIFVKQLGAVEGINSWGTSRRGYGGPCPPSGTHRYYFKLYALDVEKLVVRVPVAKKEDGPRIIEYAPGVEKLAEGILATKQDVLQVMQGHLLAEAHLMGKYKRTKK